MYVESFSRIAAYALRRTRNLIGMPTRLIISFASDVREISPEEVGQFPPPVTLEGQLDRATGSFRSSLSSTIRYATQTNVTHKATLVHTVENVVIAKGNMFKGYVSEHLSSLGWPSVRDLNTVEERVLCSTPSGSSFFGDWLLHDNLLEHIARDLAIAPLKILPHNAYPHRDKFSKLFGLSEEYSDLLRVRKLHILEDIGYNRYKRERLQRLRLSIRESTGLGSLSNKPIYLKRGGYSQPGRGLTNEGEVVDFLFQRGFTILDPTILSVSDLLKATVDCPIAIGVEGSQLSHGFLGLREGGLMLVLQPPYRFQSSFRPRCNAVGLKWGFLVGEENPGGFSIPLLELEEILAPFL